MYVCTHGAQRVIYGGAHLALRVHTYLMACPLASALLSKKVELTRAKNSKKQPSWSRFEVKYKEYQDKDHTLGTANSCMKSHPSDSERQCCDVLLLLFSTFFFSAR